MLSHLDDLAHVIDGGVRGRRRRWLSLMVLSIVGDLGLLYSQVVALENQRAGAGYQREALIFVASLAGWSWATRRLYGMTGRGLAEGTQALLGRLVERLRRLPSSRFEAFGRGDLMTRLTGDTQRVATSTSAVLGVPLAFIRLAFGGAFALSVSPDLAGASAVAMVLLGLAMAAQMEGMNRGFAAMAADEGRLYDLLRGHIAGAVPIKLHRRRSEALAGAVTSVSDALRGLRVGLYAVFFERHHLATGILYGVLGVNAFLLPLVITTDNESIREINQILVWVVFSVIGIVFTLPELSRSGDALARLHDLEAQLGDDMLEPAVDAVAQARGRFARFEALRVRALAFRYPSSPARPGFAVGPIDLTFRRGEVVFVTGFNGSGKSTFLKMLTGLYPPTAGRIEVDDTVIGPDDLADLRALFTTVFTDHYLFERAFGLTADDEARAPALLDEMDLAHKTAIAEGRISKVELSTGQRKRLALVLARLKGRPILILDEWAADQDPEYRALYYTRILPALGAEGKLVIAVTHDDQYFHCADRIVHFKAGRITVGGDPDAP